MISSKEILSVVHAGPLTTETIAAFVGAPMRDVAEKIGPMLKAGVLVVHGYQDEEGRPGRWNGPRAPLFGWPK